MQNKFLYSVSLSENRNIFVDNVEKYYGEATHDNMAHALYVCGNQCYKLSH